MTTYRYKGQTKDGTAVSGVIRAYDEFEAASRLRETVAVITRLEEVREKKENIFNRPIGLKIKEKELALMKTTPPICPRPLSRRSGPENSPARWRSASSDCTGTMINPPRPRPRWSAP